jgi:hypothetical protein
VKIGGAPGRKVGIYRRSKEEKWHGKKPPEGIGFPEYDREIATALGALQ